MKYYRHLLQFFTLAMWQQAKKNSWKKNTRIVLIWIMIQRRKESLASMLMKVLRVRPRVVLTKVLWVWPKIVLFDSFGVRLCSRVHQPWCWSKRFLTLVVWWSFLPTFFPNLSQSSSISVSCNFHSWYLKIKRSTWTKSYDLMISDERATILGETGKSL